MIKVASWLGLAFTVGCAGQEGGDTAAPGDDTGAGDSAASDSGDTDTADTGAAPDEFALLTLNLHCFKLDGTRFGDNDARFSAIAAAVAAEGVFAIAVQEACETDAEGKAIDRLAAALSAATGASWGTGWTPTHTAWAGTPDEAQEGVGLLIAGRDPTNVSTLVYSVQGGLERRLLAGSFTTAAGTAVRLATVHLDYDDPAARRAQARQSAMDVLVHADGAWGGLLAGDFNAFAADDAVMDLTAAGFTRLSSAADSDGQQIDHVFAPTAANFEVLGSRLMFTGDVEPVVSDHPGVVVHLRRHAPVETPATRFAATYDAGLGHFLTLRGEPSPLGWESGWPSVNTAPDRWEAVLLGGSGPFSYKWLLDDTRWESGENRSVAAGAAIEDYPSF